MPDSSLLLVGLGALGRELLATLPIHGIARVVVIDRDAERERVAKGAMAGLIARRDPTELEFRQVDLLDAKATDELLASVRPDVVVQAATHLPVDRWWTAARDPQYGQLFRAAGLGPWLPLQALLPMRLAEAMARCGQTGALLNASYPDGVNAWLAGGGLRVTSGTGNVGLLEHALKLAIAARYGALPRAVQVWVSAHYAHVRWAMGGADEYPPAPYLHATIDDRPIQALPVRELLREAGQFIPWGAASNHLTAACIAGDVERLVVPEPTTGHMPGPCGLPGGYPVRIGAGRVEPYDPPGATLSELQQLQRKAQRADGIEEITDDGTVVLTKRARRAMGALLGRDIGDYTLAGLTESSAMLASGLDRLAPAQAS